MRFELSRSAQADLDDVRDYSLAEHGLERASAYLDVIEAAFRRIFEFPQAGAIHETVRPPIRALGCEGHRIF